MPSYVITGVARGIGLGFLRALSSDPANTVFGLVRNLDTAEEAKKFAADVPNRNVHIIQADIVDSKALAAAADKVSNITGGVLDVLINNAGMVETEYNKFSVDEFPSPEALASDLHKYIDVNVLGVMYTINAFLPLLKKGSVKKVLSISSAMCDLEFIKGTGMTMSVTYSISKGALNVAMAKYAARFREEGISFLSMCPGLVQTRATSSESLSPDEDAVIKKRIEGVLKKVYPEFKGLLSIEDSVRMQLEVLDGLLIENSGNFVSHKGNRQWL